MCVRSIRWQTPGSGKMMGRKVGSEDFMTSENGFISSERQQPKAPNSPQRKIRSGFRTHLDLTNMDTHMTFSIFRGDHCCALLQRADVNLPWSQWSLGFWTFLLHGSFTQCTSGVSVGRENQVARKAPLGSHFWLITYRDLRRTECKYPKAPKKLLYFLTLNKYSLLCLILYS